MAELNMRWRYINLWRKLRDKYYPSSIPIYLIEGNYPVAYEGGYNWIVGYCPTLELAERAVLKLKNELREVKRRLGPYSKIERLLYKTFDEAEKLYGYKSPTIVPCKDRWIEASNRLRELLVLEISKMTDQNIPFSCSHIMSRHKNDGPVTYSFRAIYGV